MIICDCECDCDIDFQGFYDKVRLWYLNKKENFKKQCPSLLFILEKIAVFFISVFLYYGCKILNIMVIAQLIIDGNIGYAIPMIICMGWEFFRRL